MAAHFGSTRSDATASVASVSPNRDSPNVNFGMVRVRPRSIHMTYQRTIRYQNGFGSPKSHDDHDPGVTKSKPSWIAMMIPPKTAKPRNVSLKLDHISPAVAYAKYGKAFSRTGVFTRPPRR